MKIKIRTLGQLESVLKNLKGDTKATDKFWSSLPQYLKEQTEKRHFEIFKNYFYALPVNKVFTWLSSKTDTIRTAIGPRRIETDCLIHTKHLVVYVRVIHNLVTNKFELIEVTNVTNYGITELENLWNKPQ